ncbi:acyl carrier protein [Luteimonas sp. RIT-PG2_3]
MSSTASEAQDPRHPHATIGEAMTLSLPRDLPFAPSSTLQVAQSRHELSAATLQALAGFCDTHHTTSPRVLLAIFALLLQRLSGERDIAIGLRAPWTRPGLAASAPMLRLQVDPDADVLALLRQVPPLQADAAATDAPMASTLQALFGAPAAADRYEIALAPVIEDRGVTLLAHYDVALFAPATIAGWLASLEALLSRALSAPERATGALAMTSPAQLAALHALQPAPAPRVHGERIHDLIARQALATPERIAIEYGPTGAGSGQWRYADLDRQRHRIAHQLRARGVGRGDLVGICLDRSPTMVAALLAVLEAGAGYVPLDPAYPRDRLAYMAEDADLRLLLVEPATADSIDWPAERTLLLGAHAGTDADADMPPGPLAEDARSADAESVAYVIYTSGSTGKPKGVSVPHRAVVNFLQSMQHTPGLGADDRLLAITTLSFDIAVLELLLPLVTGATIVLASREQAMDGRALAQLLQAHAVTMMQATPSSWRMLLDTGWRPSPGFRALCGGEALPADLARQLAANDAQLWNMYGPTETTVWSTCERIDADAAWISIGTPIDNTTVWILDARRHPCPIGVPGEIWIGGSGVTLGYLHRADLTAERFIEDPFDARGGRLLYATGDLGRWRDDGRLEHLGRLDHQVKVRGHRIELGEIESQLASHPRVQRAVVITREDQTGDVRIVAYLVSTDGVQIDPQALRQHLRAQLPEYMVPQHFIALPAIPLLPNGKVDRKSLPSPAQARQALPGAAGPAAPSQVQALPRDPIEGSIVAIFAAVLGHSAIGIDDSFFALGGHSLLGAQVVDRINRAFTLDLPVRTIFEAPTVAALATVVRNADAPSTRVEALPSATPGPHPLTVMQERIWIHEQLHPHSVAYNIPVALCLRGALDVAALSSALDAVLARQPTLRSYAGQHSDGVFQQVDADATTTPLPIEDLGPIAPELREQAVSDHIQAWSRQRLDTTRAPTSLARLLRLSPQEHVLVLMPHHLFWDGGSTTLLCLALAEAYPSMLAGASAAATTTSDAAPAQYGDYAVWHRQRLSTPSHLQRRQRRIDHWRQWLHAHGAPVPLPADVAHGNQNNDAIAGPRAGTVSLFALTPAQTRDARALAAGHDTTLFVVLLGLCQLLLQRIGGGDHPLTGSPVRLGGHPDAEGTMGMFTHLLPVSLDIVPERTFSDLIAQARTRVLDGLDGVEVQLDDILREPDLRAFATRHSPYQAQLSFEDVRSRPAAWGALAVEALPALPAQLTEDLMLWWFDDGERLQGHLMYDAARLQPATVQTFIDGHGRLLAAAVADPGITVGALLAAAGDARNDSPAGHAAIDVALAADAPPVPATTAVAEGGISVDRQPPTTGAERLVAGIWSELLEIDDIDVRDTFFDLGGHSLLAMSMIERIEQATGTRLNLLKVANGNLRVIALALPRLPAQSAATHAAAPRGLLARMRGLFGRSSGDNTP